MERMKNRLFAMILTTMVAVSMTVPAFIEAAYAEDGQTVSENSQEVSEEQKTNEEIEQKADDPVDQEAFDPEKTETVPGQEEVEDEIPEVMLNQLQVAENSIKVKASGDEKFITVVWSKVETANYYMLYLDESTKGARVEAKKDGNDVERRYVFSNASTDRTHTVRVEAFQEKTGSDDVKLATGSATDIKALLRSKLTLTSRHAEYTGLSLRELSGQANNGFAVAQGSATDGQYAYHLMVCSVESSSNYNKGIIVRTSRDGRTYYDHSGVLNIRHGNGMTFDSRRNKLVAVGYGATRQKLFYIDPYNGYGVTEKEVNYPYSIKIPNSQGDNLWDKAKENGFGAIAYVPEYDVYLARSRGEVSNYESKTTSATRENIWVIDANTLTAIGHIYTQIAGNYPNTYQAMDADKKYVYYLISPGSGQSKNRIICLDWNSEKLLPILNGDAKYVSEMWKCGNNENGLPDTVIDLDFGHEAEGIYHTTDGDTEHFYVTEYYGRQHYKTVTKKVVKSKKKWKKVRKWYNKKTKKWTTKKPKKKYRGKSKKVWKYKYKYKTVKVKKKDYWARDDYVYDLGVI